jgi:hypothetical protein
MRYPILAALLPPSGAIIAAATIGLTPEGLTYGGGFIQLVGLGTVVVTLYRARQPFNVPSWDEAIWVRVRRAFRRLFGLKPESRTLHVHGAAHAHASAEATLRVKAGDGASVEHRLEVLEQEVESLHNRMNRLKKETRKQVKELRDKQDSHRAETSRKLQELGKKIEGIAIGDEVLRVAGAILFAWGIAFQTWSHWLAGLVG